MVREFYRLIKPGMVYGNVFTTIAGYLYASRWMVEWVPFAATLLGMALVIASACVFNNYLDRNIDAKMERTKNRAIAAGRVGVSAAIFYASTLLFFGFLFLYVYVNALTAFLALFGHVWYVLVYGWGKRSSHWGTLIGSVAGAVPIVAGYTAVTNSFDLYAVFIFLAMAFWQMPHFYAIALYRHNDYAAAGIPTLSSQKGVLATKLQITLYILEFTGVACLLTFLGAAGYAYALIVALAGAVWLIVALRGFGAQDDEKWARKIFFYSLGVLLVYSLALSLALILP